MSHIDGGGRECPTAFILTHLAVKDAFVGFGYCDIFKFICLVNTFVYYFVLATCPSYDELS